MKMDRQTRSSAIEAPLSPKARQKKNLRTLAGTALLLALLLMLQFSGLGILPISPTGVTILQVPVIVATLCFGFFPGLFMGTAFGILSMYSAYATPMLFSAPFLNPVVALLPRMLIPVCVFLAGRLLRYDASQPRLWKSAALAVVGSAANTLFVLTALGIFYGDIAAEGLGIQSQSLFLGIAAYGLVSGVPEAGVSALIVAPVMTALRKFNQKA